MCHVEEIDLGEVEINMKEVGWRDKQDAIAIGWRREVNRHGGMAVTEDSTI